MNTIQDPDTGRTWSTVRELTDYIVSVYHGYLRLALPVLDRLIERIAREHLLPVSLMDRVGRQFTALADLLETHIAKAECLVFPKIQHLREPVGEICWACQLDDGLEEQMRRLAQDKEEALSLMQQIEICLSDARWRDKGPMVDQFVADIRELRENFANHTRVETEILFPHVRGMLHPHGLAV